MISIGEVCGVHKRGPGGLAPTALAVIIKVSTLPFVATNSIYRFHLTPALAFRLIYSLQRMLVLISTSNWHRALYPLSHVHHHRQHHQRVKRKGPSRNHMSVSKRTMIQPDYWVLTTMMIKLFYYCALLLVLLLLYFIFVCPVCFCSSIDDV
jgi:hypothetical protein